MNKVSEIRTFNSLTGIASDHAGYKLKNHIIDKLREYGCEVVDFGTYSEDSVDYPDFAHRLGNAIDAGELKFGIAICYTGNGINIALNRHKGVRSAICWNQELAVLAREHNNANVCALSSRFVSPEDAENIVETFISTAFTDEVRHLRRIKKINNCVAE